MADDGIGSRDAAQEACNHIMDYWAKKGYVVDAYPVRVKTTVQGEEESVKALSGWGLRTDMINGWPRKLWEERQRAALA